MTRNHHRLNFVKMVKDLKYVALIIEGLVEARFLLINHITRETLIMAKDALALLDHLGWKKAHIFGHSMGSMIASKLAAIAPERVSSLALLNTSGGGFECCPKLDRQTVSLAYRFLRAKTPEQRAILDLEVHYTKEFLDEQIGSSSRREILYQEYVKGITKSGMQSSHGFEGQINACWTHKLTQIELDRIRSAGILISVIHGRNDIIAKLCNARRMAEKLYPVARIVELHGAHFVSHERSHEVNLSLMELIKAAKTKLEPEKWTNLTLNNKGRLLSGLCACQSCGFDFVGIRTKISEMP
ncbi:hypothetical protein LUZ60_012672 [Juncus effusus]|nr:hypothetical protein LUZ60_012672 [Juncus effusus]